MKSLRNFLDRLKPHFAKDGRFHYLHSFYDAIDTFLFVPPRVTSSGAHIRDAIDLKRTMSVVVIALIPALLVGMFNVGLQHYMARPALFGKTWLEVIQEVGWLRILWNGALTVIPIILVTYISGGIVEVIFAQVRGHSVNEGFFVSGLLIPLIVPPTIPLWMVAVATVFAVIFGKEVFGGTGMNIVNPALLARAFLFFAYPAHMSGSEVWITQKPDVVSGATPLALAASSEFDKMPSFFDMFIGFIPGSIGETSVVAILLGALLLLITGVGSARIMLSVLAGAIFTGVLFNVIGANEYMKLPFYYHLVMGGFAFGAVFMATDPVSAAQTAKGKIIYGFLIGMLTIIIRVLNPAYPEGMMLAILLMNVFAPLIDHYVIEAHVRHRIKRANILHAKYEKLS